MQHINTLLDPVVNFGKVTVSTGYTSTDTTITLITGDGSKLPNPVPSGSFNLVWFNNSTYSDPADDPYVEIVRCIARVGDTLTLMRAQEGTLASNKNLPTKIYKMILSPTKKVIDDIQTESQSKVDTHSLITSNVHNFDSSGNAPAQTHGISRHTGTIGNWTSIDKTISSIGDITTRSHTLLTDIGTNTHAIIDTAILNSTTHINSSIAHGVTSNIVGISDIQTLTNKTLTSPFISTIYGSSIANGVITIEGTSDATKTSSYVILQPTSGNVGIGTAIPTAKLHIGGTAGVDGIKFPDGTLQTTAVGGAATNLLIGLTPTFTLWDSLPSTNAQITDENLDQAFTTAGGFTRENWVYISFDLGSEKRIAALAYIESASQYRSGIQFSHNGSTWYSVPNGIGKTRYIRAGMYGSYPPMTYTCTKFKMSAYAL